MSKFRPMDGVRLDWRKGYFKTVSKDDDLLTVNVFEDFLGSAATDVRITGAVPANGKIEAAIVAALLAALMNRSGPRMSRDLTSNLGEGPIYRSRFT